MEQGEGAGRLPGKMVSVYLLSLAASLILFHSVVLSVLTPLPQVYSALRKGRWAGLSIFGLLLLAAGFEGWGMAAGYLLQFGLPGLLITEALLRGWSVEKGFLLAVALSSSLAIMSLSLYASGEGVTSREMVRGSVEKVIGETIALNRKSGQSADYLKEFERLAPVVSGAIVDLYPALVVAGLMGTVWINLMALAGMARRAGTAPPFGGLSRWKAPEYLVWGVIAGGAAFFSGSMPLRVAGMNLLLVLFVVYFFQGMAILSFYFNGKGVAGPLKGIVYFVVVWYLSVVVAVMGLFDLWFDFRRLAPGREVKE